MMRMKGLGIVPHQFMMQFKDALGILVLTEWDEFKSINWEKVSLLTMNPIWLFDTRNICNINEARKNNILVWNVGL